MAKRSTDVIDSVRCKAHSYQSEIASVCFSHLTILHKLTSRLQNTTIMVQRFALGLCILLVVLLVQSHEAVRYDGSGVRTADPAVLEEEYGTDSPYYDTTTYQPADVDNGEYIPPMTTAASAVITSTKKISFFQKYFGWLKFW